MKKILAVLIGLFSINAFSADLICDISVNLDILSESTVTTKLNDKTPIDTVGNIVAYVTEKEKSHFIIEAFLADHEMRIYGEGALRESTDKIVASAWSRDSIIDIECRLDRASLNR